MFGLSWAELMIAAVVALIVIGPKELPVVFRKLGQFVAKAKAMGRDFSRAMNEAADASGAKDAMDDLNSIGSGLNAVKEPTKAWTSYVPGTKTAELAEKRAAETKDRTEAAAARAQERLDAVKAANAAAENVDGAIGSEDKEVKEEAPAKPVAKKPTAKKTATKKTAAKKTAAKKTAAANKPVAAKKPAAAQKTAAKKPATKKPAPKTSPKKAPDK